MAQEGPEAVQAAIEPAVPSDPAAKGAGSVSGAGVGQQDAPDHSLMENMEGAGNAKDGETNDAQDPLGTGSVQVEFEEPTVLNITFGNFTQRPVSKLPPEVVKTVAPAPSKEKKKDPYHIFPISQMLQSAGNFVGTVEWRLARDDARATQALSKIDDLKARDSWSFRQLKKHVAPPRTKTHWDFMLEEMEWLREDFLQERRWKIAAAFTVSCWVMEWHNAKDKSALCVKRRSSKEPVAAENEAGDDSMEALPATSNDSTISSSIAKTGRKRRRDSDEVMEEAPVAEFVAPDGGPAKGGSLEIQMTDVTDAALADNRKTGTSGDEEGVTPVEGKPGTDENPEDDVASTAAAQSKAASTLPARLIIRSRPGLTHVDLGLGPLPDDSKNVYSFADKLDRQYMDPLNNANVVPVSRMMSVKTRYAEIRWDQYGQDKQARKRVRLTRATDWKLEVPNIVGPFFSVKKRDSDKRPLAEPSGPKPRGIAQAFWTQEEDDVLMAFGKIYQHNWALISELMTAEHMPKTAWECYERYTALDTPEQRAKPRVARVDAKDRLNKHQKIISFILKRIRTREPRPTPNGGPPRKINLVAHETHQQAQTDAGVDLNSRPLTPLELSQVKARHDQEVRAQAETHRAQQFGQRGAAVGGLPARPGFVQIPVQQVPGYRPVGRPGMALQAGGAALQQAVRVPGLAQGTTAALQRLPAGITPETLKQVMLARALQQQQQQQQQQQAVAAAVARAQPGTAAGFPLPLQVQSSNEDIGRQFSAGEIQAAQTVIAGNPTLRAHLLQRQQQALNQSPAQAQRANLTQDQLMQIAALRANPDGIARPAAQPAQNQAFQQQRLQLLMQQSQQAQAGLLQAQQLQALQTSNAATAAAQAAAAAAAAAPQQADGESPARKRK